MNSDLLSIEWGGNSVEDYLMALGVFAGIYIGIYLFKLIVLSRVRRWVKKTKTDIDDEMVNIVDDIPHKLYLVIAFYAGLEFLDVHEWINHIADALLIIMVVYWLTHLASQLVEYLLGRMSSNSPKRSQKAGAYFVLMIVAKIALWSTGILLILSNLGVNISAFVASLGIGGVAIALAVQNILSDIFSSFSIYFDRPFALGDYIIVGDHQGTVKHIGLKTTRIQALQGEEIVISNRELTSTRIRNFKKMKKRRVAFGFGVTYATDSKQLEAIPDMVEKIINKIETAEFDRAHFKEFADSSLHFEVVYYVTTREYKDYMDTQQAINFSIKRAFEKEKIEMAFPTRTLHVIQEAK